MAKILVIDDEMGIRELLSEILDDEGHESVLANNAEQGHAAHLAHAFDLVLLDIWMPGKDGMTLLREWSTTARLTCPVIMMSGHATIETAAEAQALGAVDFLEKPITLHKLLSSVHKCLARYQKTAAPKNERTEAAPEPSAERVPEHSPTKQSDVKPSDSSAAQQAEMPVDALAPESVGLALDVSVAVSVGISANAFNIDSSATNQAAAPHWNAWQEKLAAIDLEKPLREVRDQLERVYFTYLLQREHWAITKVAEICGLERTHLYRKLKQLNIEISRAQK